MGVVTPHQASPGTHPPCNDQNPCAMIIEEIRRGCGFITEGSQGGPPAFCKDYSAQPSGK
jgi:hypothetical protein